MSSVAATSAKARNTQHRVRVTGRSPVPMCGLTMI